MTEERGTGTGSGAGRDTGDDELRGHLRQSVPLPPLDEVAWNDLARTIGSRAEPFLRARRRPPWWRHASQWARAGIPLAAAAVLALALLLPRAAPRAVRPTAARLGSAAASAPAGAGVAASDASVDPLLAFLSTADDGETLLMSALEEE